MDKRAGLRQHFQQEENQAQELEQYKQRTAQLAALEGTLVDGFNALMQFMDGKTTKTEVVNQLKSISTPDVDKVVQALSKLDKDILSNKLDLKPVTDGLNGLKRELSLIPKTLPKIPEQKDSVKVTNLSEIKLDTSAVEKAIKGLKLDVKAPIINEKEVDLKPLQNIMLDLLKAVQAQKPVEMPKFPEIPVTDLTKVETKLDKSNKLLKEITEKKFGGGGGGGGGVSFQNSAGEMVRAELDADGNVPVSTTPGTLPLITDDITAVADTVIADVAKASNLVAQCYGTFAAVNCIFEGSVNSTNGTDGNWVTIQAVRSSANTVETTTGSLSAAPAYGWEMSVNAFAYVRVRCTARTSGTQTWVLQRGSYATEPIPAIQTHAVTGTVAVTMAANATTTPAKARDAVAGATDTGIPAFNIRRDTPTNVTAIAGDYEPGQVDAQGSRWVRSKISQTPTVTSVAGSATSVTLKASNTNRLGLTLYNNSTADAYVKLGATATTADFTVKLVQDGYYEVPFNYTGIVDCIWSSATGAMLVTELTT